jgi:hypothetical protein
MNQVRVAKRKRLRETKELALTMVKSFTKLVKLLGAEAPPEFQSAPELFGVMETVSDCLAFFPAFIAMHMESRGEPGGEHEHRRDAVNVVDRCWQQVKAELLEGLTQ